MFVPPATASPEVISSANSHSPTQPKSNSWRLLIGIRKELPWPLSCFLGHWCTVGEFQRSWKKTFCESVYFKCIESILKIRKVKHNHLFPPLLSGKKTVLFEWLGQGEARMYIRWTMLQNDFYPFARVVLRRLTLQYCKPVMYYCAEDTKHSDQYTIELNLKT